MTPPSDLDVHLLSGLEDGPTAVPRELVMPRNNTKELIHQFTTPSGIRVSIVQRGKRGWFFNHKAPWSENRLRHLITKVSRDEAVRLATSEIEALYKLHAIGPTPTLISVAAEMLVAKKREGRAVSYTRKIEEHLRTYLGPALGIDTPIGNITGKEMLEFKHRLGASDLEPETANRVLTSLRQLMKYATDPGGYIECPSLPRNFRSAQWKTRERWTILVPTEITAMLKLAPDEVRPILGYVANTGLRIGSALATEASWIDFPNRRVRYPASAMKGRHAHTIELSTAAEMFLKQALEVSPSKPFDFTYWFVLDRWLPIREQLGKPTLRIHDLRHSFVSNQLAAGTPVHVVQRMAAHRSLSVTALYAHSTDEAQKAAADRVQVGVDAPPAPAPPADVRTASPKATNRPHLRVVK